MSKNIFWSMLCAIIVLIGGYAALFHDEFAAKPSVASPRSSCAVAQATIRGQIDLYERQQGRSPWAPGEVDETQWRPLIEKRYLTGAMRNPYSPDRPKISTRIIELTEPGATGAGVDPGEAGWVWNSTDNRFYATGLPDDQ